MEYRRIYYREAPDAAPEHPFEYQINFVMGEGSISYLNNDGGFTTRGAKLNEHDLEHFKLILDKGRPEQYREGLQIVDCSLKMDGFSWELLIDYMDGTPELQINNFEEDNLEINKTIEMPAFIQELRKYALVKLGLEDSRKGKEI